MFTIHWDRMILAEESIVPRRQSMLTVNKNDKNVQVHVCTQKDEEKEKNTEKYSEKINKCVLLIISIKRQCEAEGVEITPIIISSCFLFSSLFLQASYQNL